MLRCLESLAESYTEALDRAMAVPADAGRRADAAAVAAESRPERLEEWDASISKDSVEVGLDRAFIQA